MTEREIAAAKKAFSLLQKTEVQIYRLVNSSQYSGGAELEEAALIKADIQPYRGELSEQTFGWIQKCEIRMYCDECGDIAAGNFARIDGIMYRIDYVERCDMGLNVFLERSDSDAG